MSGYLSCEVLLSFMMKRWTPKMSSGLTGRQDIQPLFLVSTLTFRKYNTKLLEYAFNSYISKHIPMFLLYVCFSAVLSIIDGRLTCDSLNGASREEMAALAHGGSLQSKYIPYKYIFKKIREKADDCTGSKSTETECNILNCSQHEILTRCTESATPVQLLTP